MANPKLAKILSICNSTNLKNRDGGASVSGSIMSNEDSEDLEKLSYYGDQMPPQMVAQKMGLPKQGVIKFAPEQLRKVFLVFDWGAGTV